MKVICGLGNPGKEFKFTRHNLGFLVLDNFQKENSFPDFEFSEKFLAEVSKKIFNGKKVVLFKPQIFMNDSGRALKKLFFALKFKTENLCLIHDDLDLPFGRIKISFKKNAGGHKGVQSVIDELSTKNFWRIRIGIGKEQKEKTEKFVLEEFSVEEKKGLKEILNFTNELLKIWIEHPQKSQSLARFFQL